MIKLDLRLILIIVILGLVGVFVWQRSRIIKLKEKYQTEQKEKERVQRNWDASKDTIRTYIDKNGRLVSEIQAYELNKLELKSGYDSIFKLYKYEKNKPPKTIVEYVTVIKEVIDSVVLNVNDGDITFVDSANFGDDNYRILSGKIPYDLNNYIKPGSVTKFYYDKASIYSQELVSRGLEGAFVVAYKDDERINNSDALKTEEVIFKVQIAASYNKKLDIDSLSNKYNLNNEIDEVYENGYYKYLTGSFVGNSKPPGDILVEKDQLNIYPKLTLGLGKFNLKQSMTINTGLYKDPETDKILIRVLTDYPGITFSRIVGADIMADPVSKKVARDFRKEFGLGLHVGYGLNITNEKVKGGFNVSVGLNWTPKFLQF